MPDVSSTSDYTPGRERFMLLGPPGVGKSTLFSTLPGKKFAYVFDSNAVASYKRPGIDYKEFFADEVSVHAEPLSGAKKDGGGNKREPKTYLEWEAHWDDALTTGFFDRYDVIGFDSLTAFQRLVMERTMYMAGRFGSWPSEGDYAPIIGPISNVCRALCGMDKTIFVTAHLMERGKKDAGKPDLISLFTRTLRSTIPSLFTDIYRCIPDVDRNNNKMFFVKTAQDRGDAYLRCSLPGIAVEEEVTIPDDGWQTPENFGLGALLKKAEENRRKK